jgi:hypothetical protein
MATTLTRLDQLGAGPSLRERFAVWGLAFVFFVVFVPRMLDYLKPPTGDEVFYLITAQSILSDHDLDETNQFASKAWLEYYPTCAEFRAPGWKGFSPGGIPCSPDAKLEPQATHTMRPGLYTKHGLALSFIIAPAYALGGRTGVVILLNGLAALLALNIFLLAWEASGQRRVAWLSWATLSFAAPVFSYAYLIFPQLVGGLCVLYAFRRARWAALSRLAATADDTAAAPANSVLQMIAVAACLGTLPWLHNLYLLLAVALVMYLYLGGRRGVLRWTASLGGHGALLVIISVLAYLYVARFLYLYGVPWPPPQDHHGFLSLPMFPVGFFGLLFDQKYGLLMYNPVYLIAIAWLFRLWWTRRQLSPAWRSELAWLLAIIGPYYLVVADYSRWWGEWCTPARYLLPVAPLLTLPLARALVHAHGRFLTWYLRAAAVWAWALTAAFIVNPILSYNWEDPKPCKVLLSLENHYGVFRKIALGNFFPYYVNFIEPLTPVYYVAHVAWLVLAVWLGWRLVRSVEPVAAKGEVRCV